MEKTKRCESGIWLKADTSEGIVIMQAPCKRWTCDVCGEINVARWQTRIKYAMRQLGGDWQFVTFTAHENWRGTDASLENIRRNSDKLWKRWQRMARKRYGRTFPYVRVFEPHRDGSLHVHAFVNADYRMYDYQNMRASKRERRPARKTPLKPRRWLKNNSRYCGMGYQTDVQKITDSGKAAWYITKYLSKNLMSENFPKGVRRIVATPSIPKPPFMTKKPSGLQFEAMVHGIETELLYYMFRAGQRVYFLNEKRDIRPQEVDFSYHVFFPGVSYINGEYGIEDFELWD